MERVGLMTVVWGRDFTDSFLKVCLPSQLTPGNLPSLADHTRSTYRIYTTSESAKKIQCSPAYKHLSAILPVEIVTISGVSYVGKFKAMNQCHKHFIESVGYHCDAFIITVPDVVWADGAFSRLLEIFRTGKKMVAISTPRLAKETFVPALLDQFGQPDGLKPIKPRELVKLAMDHLHPVATRTFYDGDFVWPVGQEGLLLRTFYLQPIMVSPVDKGVVPNISIDSDYILKACPDPSDIYIVRDSDDMCLMDYTSLKSEHSMHPSISTGDEIVHWAQQNADVLHRHFIRQYVRLHSTDCSEAWNAKERESDETVEPVLRALGSERVKWTQITTSSKDFYLSPSFLAKQFQQLGPLRFIQKTVFLLARLIARRLLGDHLRIRINR